MHQVKPTLLNIKGSDEKFPVRRVYCVGRNYSEHSIEMGGQSGEKPFFFSKPQDAVTQESHIPYPKGTEELHYEAELVIFIGHDLPQSREPTEQEINDAIYGYATGIDLTRRDLQRVCKSKSRPWTVAKAFDLSAPVGEILPAGEIDWHLARSIMLWSNDVLKQDGRLEQMSVSPVALLKELQSLFDIKAGDVLFTGTPAGVGVVNSGDHLRVEIEGLTELSITIGDKK